MCLKTHFIGIGGIGMSALAHILLERGSAVTGSDLKKCDITGAEIFEGHDPKHLGSATRVIIGSAIQTDNPEYTKALQQKLEILHRSDLLHELMQGYTSLLVTGAHGKTSTSGLLSWVLLKAGLDPSFAIGGYLNEINQNAQDGNGKYFVAEADESDGSFLKTAAFGAILTNYESEHLSYWKSEALLKEAYRTFISQVRNRRIFFWCHEDPFLNALKPGGVSYGFSKGAKLLGTNFQQKEFTLSYDMTFEGQTYTDITLPQIGRHQALNSMAVFGLSLRLGIDAQTIREAFLSYPGIKRRLSLKLEKDNITYLDDYAHHPTEIQATIQALKGAFKQRRLLIVFQPHRYSRLKDYFSGFCTCFDSADEVMITEVFAAGETPLQDISSEQLLKQMTLKNASYLRTSHISSYLKATRKKGDLVVLMGAGDIHELEL